MKESIDSKEDGVGEPSETAEGPATISYLCMKYNRHQQGPDLACQDPELYCKYRTSCLIHFKEKQDRQDRRRMDSSED